MSNTLSVYYLILLPIQSAHNLVISVCVCVLQGERGEFRVLIVCFEVYSQDY